MPESTSRLHFLDNLKSALIILVIFHHIAIAYGAEGIFIINSITSPPLLLSGVLSLLVAINQSYFMGLFFVISAFFSGKSLKKKGRNKFIKGKFKRLMIPVLLYFFLLSPFIKVVILLLSGEALKNFDYARSLNLGPLWFMFLLFLFDMFYAFWGSKENQARKAFIITPNMVMLAVASIGVITFLIRTFSPVGSMIPHIGIQVAHLPQYIFAYSLGLMLGGSDYLRVYNPSDMVKSLWISLLSIVGLFVFIALSPSPVLSIQQAMGGLNITSLLYSVWEQVMFISMSMGLISLFHLYANSHNALSLHMATYSFDVYFIHFLASAIVIGIVNLLSLPHMISFGIALVGTILLSYLMAYIIHPVFNN